MAKNCEVCGREFDALYPKTSFEKHEVCKVCKSKLLNFEGPDAFELLKKQVAEEQEKCKDFADWSPLLEFAKNFPATTGYGLEGYDIKDYLGVTGGEVALGTGFLTSFASALSDIYGVENPVLTDKIRAAKDFALAKLIKNCADRGANAVIGVNFELVSLDYLIIASANGTAVKIEKKN